MSVAPPATSGPEVPAAPSVPQALPAQRPKPAARPKPAPLPAKPERPAAAEQKQAGDLPAPALEGSAMSDEAPPAPEPEVESEALVAPPAARAQRSESAPPAEPLPELRMLRRRASAPEPQAPGVTLTRGTSSIEVRLPLPAFATPGNPVALVLRDVEGGRELREGRVVTIGATFLSIDLPLAWATPGSYQAEVIDARPRATRQAATYSFSID